MVYIYIYTVYKLINQNNICVLVHILIRLSLNIENLHKRVFEIEKNK
jgi:hypothetical protein